MRFYPNWRDQSPPPPQPHMGSKALPVILPLMAMLCLLFGCRKQEVEKSTEVSNLTASTVSPRLSISTGIENGVTSMAVTPDGKLVAAQGHGETKNIEIWDVEKREKLRVLDNGNPGQMNMTLLPDGKTFAYMTIRNLRVIEIASGKPLKDLEADSLAIVFYSEKNDALVSVNFGRVRGCDIKSGKQIADWEADKISLSCMCQGLTDKNQVATGHRDCTIKIWDFPTGKLLQTLSSSSEKDNYPLAITMTRDGSYLAWTSVSEGAKVWDVASGKQTKTIQATSSLVLLFLPDNKTLAYQDRDNNIILENVDTGDKRVLAGHTAGIWQMAATPDGKTLVSGGSGKDGTIKIWDLQAP